jgi:hypothetical protein
LLDILSTLEYDENTLPEEMQQQMKKWKKDGEEV